MKTKIIYGDKAGNKLYERFIKTRNVIQLSAKNHEGKLVNQKGLFFLMKKAGIKVK